MAKKSVFFSFHFDNDFWRTQQVRQIGVIEGKEPISKCDWEEVKRKGNIAIQNWINENLKYKNCTIVLIGSETYNRPWVLYEIEKSWEMNKGIFGIYIHELKDINRKTSNKGKNPFDYVFYNSSEKLSKLIKVYEPQIDFYDTLIYPDKSQSQLIYKKISDNIEKWVEDAITQKIYFELFGY